MSVAAGRSIEVDFLRGAVLIVIAIDHISRGILQHAMLHSYAYCDAAEVFVFLGGYASAAGYTSLAARHGELAAGPAVHARFGVPAVVVGNDVDDLHLVP